MIIVMRMVTMIVSFVVEVEHRRTRVVALVVTKRTRLVARMHLLQFMTFLFSLCRSELWVRIELFVHPIHVELGASFAFCTLAVRPAFSNLG